jgi:hypothetical protein
MGQDLRESCPFEVVPSQSSWQALSNKTILENLFPEYTDRSTALPKD